MKIYDFRTTTGHRSYCNSLQIYRGSQAQGKAAENVARLKQQLRPHEKVVGVEYTQAARLFEQAAAATGLSILKPVLYSLRHGGASFDTLFQKRPLPEVKSRGRWRADSSLRRYQKAAPAQQQLCLMPDNVIAHAKNSEAALGDLLNQHLSDLL